MFLNFVSPTNLRETFSGFQRRCHRKQPEDFVQLEVAGLYGCWRVGKHPYHQGFRGVRVWWWRFCWSGLGMKVEGPGWLCSRQGGFHCDFSGKLHVLCWPECRMKENLPFLTAWEESQVQCFDDILASSQWNSLPKNSPHFGDFAGSCHVSPRANGWWLPIIYLTPGPSIASSTEHLNDSWGIPCMPSWDMVPQIHIDPDMPCVHTWRCT